MSGETLPSDRSLKRRKAGLILGPLLFVALLLIPIPESLSPPAQRTAAVTALMAVWWVSEAVPMAATAMIPLVLFPLLSILEIEKTAEPFANPNIFLFLGGFLIAMAMQKWNLHKRIALQLIVWVGGGPRRMLASFMAATAAASMWVSNTATAVMMLPIAMAMIVELEREDPLLVKAQGFGKTLMLGIAYAASVGGVATLIGTPTNVIFSGQAETLFPELGEIGFVKWTLFALPLTAGFLVWTWYYLSHLHAKLPTRTLAAPDYARKELRALGRWSYPEIAVASIACATGLAWATRRDLEVGPWSVSGWESWFGLSGIHDAVVVMASAVLLFAIPADLKQGRFLLDWEWAKKVPFGILILLGGGFALAKGFDESGLAAWIGAGFEGLKGVPPFLLVFAICAGVTFLTELTSNTATATMMMPILASASMVIGVHPFLLMIPAAVSASFAFMLPVATPPNAIVFGSGHLRIPDMARAGFILNLTGAVWITLIVFLLAHPLFEMNRVP